MATKHFNKGVVRGRILELKVRRTTAGKRPYLELRVFCPSSIYGDVTVTVRFWGGKIEDLKAAYKERQDGLIYFDGDVSLLESRGSKFMGFNAYRFRPWAGSQDDQPRASFIIEGELRDNFERFGLRHVQEKEEHSVDSLFEFPLPEYDAGASPGDTVRVYGHLKDLHARFGGDGMFEPVIEEVTVRERGGLTGGD